MLAEPRICPASMKSGADALRQVDRLAIDRASTARIEAVEGVEHRVKRRGRLVVRFLPSSLAQIRPHLFFLQVRGIEHDKPGELTGGRGRDDFPAKAALGEQRQAPAMIEVCMRQQHPIDAGGIEARRTRGHNRP